MQIRDLKKEEVIPGIRVISPTGYIGVITAVMDMHGGRYITVSWSDGATSGGSYRSFITEILGDCFVISNKKKKQC